MLRSKVVVLFLAALAAQFTALSTFAEKCEPTDQTLEPGDDCGDAGGGTNPPIPPAKADLVPNITSVSFAGGKVTVAMTLSNDSEAAAVQSQMRLALFARKGSGFVVQPFLTQELTVSALQPSASIALTAHPKTALSSAFNHRNHKVCVTADAENQVEESSESNNTVCRQLLFQVLPSSVN